MKFTISKFSNSIILLLDTYYSSSSMGGGMGGSIMGGSRGRRGVKWGAQCVACPLEDIEA